MVSLIFDSLSDGGVMITTNTVFIYLFLVRLVTTLLVGKLYLNKKTKTNFALVIASLIYALSAALRVYADYSTYIGTISGIFAIIGLSFIMAYVLGLVYSISLNKLAVMNILVCASIFVLSLTYYFAASISVFVSQTLILVLSLIAISKKRLEFKSFLSVNYYWLLGVLFTGLLVLGVYLFSSLSKINTDVISHLLTFITSLMLSVFFVQFEYITQNRQIEKANNQLTEEISNQEAIKNRLDAMIANISDVISIIDMNMIVKYVSPNIEKWFGWKPEDLIGDNGYKLINLENSDFTIDEYNDFITIPDSQEIFDVEYKCKNGDYKQVKMTAINLIKNPNINGILLNYHDISKQKNLEKEKLVMEAHIRNQQLLESIGLLAAGVAHEINNPINGVMNYAQLLMDMPGNNSEKQEYLKEIVFESERIASIVKNLLQFSRVDNQEHSYAKVEDIINGTLSLIQTIFRHDQILLSVDIPKGLPELKCRSQQIQQVIMNLMTNARDSLNEKYSQYNKNKICKIYCELKNIDNRDWIRVTVEDHGNGIDDTIKDRIFEPFYTTKERNKGTGLGLSISNRIAEEHNGKLSFETELGEQTKFHLDLPCDNE